MLLIYGSLLLAKRHWELHWLLEGYVTDVLCLPIMLTLSLFLIRKWKGIQFSLSPLMIVVAVVYVSLIFEVLLPRLATQYYQDWWDVLAYGIGGLAFFFLQRMTEARALVVVHLENLDQSFRRDHSRF